MRVSRPFLTAYLFEPFSGMEVIGLWKRVNSTPIMPRSFEAEAIDIYECQRPVILENGVAVSPALCIYKNWQEQYVVAVFTPKYSHKQLGIKRMVRAKVFDSLNEAKSYAINYMSQHPPSEQNRVSIVLSRPFFGP